MSDTGPGAEHCHAHGRVSEELRVLAEQLAERVQPWLERMAEPVGKGQDGAGAPCTSCPVCALISSLRGERPELVIRLAEHASGLLAVARELLAQPPQRSPAPTEAQASGPATPPAPAERPAGEHAAPRTTVQHVAVRHVRARPTGPGRGA